MKNIIFKIRRSKVTDYAALTRQHVPQQNIHNVYHFNIVLLKVNI